MTLFSEPQSHTRTRTVSQAKQARIARQERRRALFTQVQELAAQGWSGASLSRMLGIHKKTAVKYAAAEHFPASRSDRGRKLAPYLPFLRTHWAAEEHNIALLYQTIRSQGYSGSEASVRQYVTSLRKEIGPPRRLRSRNASALAPWLTKATTSEVPELRTFAEGIRRDQAAVLAALTSDNHSYKQTGNERQP